MARPKGGTAEPGGKKQGVRRSRLEKKEGRGRPKNRDPLTSWTRRGRKFMNFIPRKGLQIAGGAIRFLTHGGKGKNPLVKKKGGL